MAPVEDTTRYLSGAPFSNLAGHVVNPHLAEAPAVFFLLASSSEAQAVKPDDEALLSQLIQQLSQELGITEIFLDDVHTDILSIETNAPDADQRLQSGAINGLQHAQCVSAAPLTVISVDEHQNYANYMDVLAQWKAHNERAQAALALLDSGLKRTIVLGNKTIQGILIRGASYRAGRTSLNEYIRHLTQQAEQTGLDLAAWPDILELRTLALQEQEIDVEQARREIELFGDKLMQALSEKEVWMRQTIEALSAAQPGEMHELEAQLEFLTDYLNNSFAMRKLRESLFFRIAMYGAHAEGLDELEKPREMVSRGRREKAFITGVLQGPTQILMALTTQLLAADARSCSAVPAVYDFILDIGVFTGFDDHDMPNLVQYVQYGNQYRALVTPRLLRRLEDLEFQVLEQAVANDKDREVVHVHHLLTTLRKRVMLHYDWGKHAQAFAKEQPPENLALALKTHHLVQAVLKKEVRPAFDALHKAESLAREYYQRLERRGQIMAANLRAEVGTRGLQRAIVYIGEQSCQALLGNLRRQEPNWSYAVLHPGQDAEAYRWPEYAAPNPAAAPSSGELPVVYADADEDLGVLLRKQCENPLCRVTAPGVYQRVVCTTPPGSRAVFYCATCKKLYCGLELKAVAVSDQELEDEFSIYPLEFPELSRREKTFSLQCRHCGQYIGKRGHTVIWTIPQ